MKQKIIFEFDDFPNDDSDLYIINNAKEFFFTLLDIEQYVRNLEKGDITKSGAEVMEDFFNILNERGVDLYK